MKKNFLKILVIAIVFFFCTTANAMTGVEFMQCNGGEQADILKPFIIYYASQGYKNVPHWASLAVEIENQIRRWGSGNKNIEGIIFEAAKAKGMTQWR